ncbi:hypothetical protein P5673_019420 [Acropora cervicornis]|uniref:Uncharacterized protein n=1 Tax=Acropora cervicornis TaxID=6130 RepID=A0AAD9QBQ4_ACRCE|nr:hypothetical protein P5673_019420 [Acropora cervicornis]
MFLEFSKGCEVLSFSIPTDGKRTKADSKRLCDEGGKPNGGPLAKTELQRAVSLEPCLPRLNKEDYYFDKPPYSSY